MEGQDETKDCASKESNEMDSTERGPAEGAEDIVEGTGAASMAAAWCPNEEFLKALVEMGVSQNAAEKGLYYTGNISAEAAAEWVFDNVEQPDLHEPFQIDHSLTGFAALKENIQSPYKMIFVVNDSLKMGVGKIAAQVGHAAVGLYRELAETKGEHTFYLLEQWQGNGETKIVVKGETTQALMDLESLAMEHRLPSYLVTDAGRTQVTPGAVTVLGLIGSSHELDKITGKLKLL